VVSSQPNINTPVLGPITLAPGATAPFSGSYTVSSSPGPATIPLLSATSFAVLAGAGITVAGAVNSTTITGDIGTFPTPSITGLGNVVLNGVNHADDAVTQTAKNDLVTAYNDAAGRPPTTTYNPIFDLGGQTLPPGVYRDPTSFGITGTLTLDAGGDQNAVWIFQAGSTLITAANSSIVLINGAQAANVFWQVGSSATLGTGSSLAGTIMALESITLTTGASLSGRALARNGAVTLDANSIAIPQSGSVAPNNTVTATGIDTCQARTVTAAVNCLGPVAPTIQSVSTVQPLAPVIGPVTMANGFFNLTFPTENGKWYTVQFKNTWNDPTWTDLETVLGTGGNLPITDTTTKQQSTRFYRFIFTP